MTIQMAYDGYIGRGTQSALLTGVPATKFQRITDATITYKQPNKKVVPHIQKGRGFVDVIKGIVEVSGNVSGFLTPDEIFGGIGWADLLGGSNTVSGSASVGLLHTFYDYGAYSSYGSTLEILKGNTQTVMWDMIGMFLNDLSLSMPHEDMVKFSADYLGVTEETGGSVSTAVFSTAPPAEGVQVTIEYGASLGASLTTIPIITDATYKYSNGLKIVRGLGSRYGVGRTIGRQSITLDFTQMFQDDLTLYNYFKNNTETAIVITITHDSLAGTSSGNYYWKISLPRVTWMGDSPELTGQENLNKNSKLQALYSSTYGYIQKVEILNSESGTYSV